MATTTAPISLVTPARPAATSRRLLPLGIAIALYTATTAAILFASWLAAHHHFVYLLDDSYIAMAMAKSLAFHGTWGITRFAFTSSSSSPLFTLLLALVFRLTGVHQLTPLLLSWTFGLIAILQADRIAARHLGPRRRTEALVAIVAFSPLFAVGVLGMEHTLHLALVLAFLGEIEQAERPYRLAVISALMVSARYESLFLIAAAAILLARRRAWSTLAWMAASAAVPVVLYGLFARHHGAYFLPESVALKGSLPQRELLLTFLATKFRSGPHVLVLVVALFAAAAGLWKSRPVQAQLALLMALAGSAHLICAGFGSVSRYEAYFVASAILILALALSCRDAFSPPLRRIFLGAVLLSIVLVSGRAVRTAVSLPGYSRGIYLQQRQMARFLATSFPQASVAANDIGAISLFTDIHCTDLVGLANNDIFFAKRAHRYTTGFVSSEVRKNGVQIAIVYDTWFTGQDPAVITGPPLPPEWTRVARLAVPDSGNLGSNVVSFYAVQSSMVTPLRTALQSFEPTLPSQDRLIFDR